MQFGLPNASPVTVATLASSRRNIAKSVELFINLFFSFFPKKYEMSGKHKKLPQEH